MKKIVLILTLLLFACTSTINEPRYLNYKLMWFAEVSKEPFPVLIVREKGDIKAYQGNNTLENVNGHSQHFRLIYLSGVVKVWIGNEGWEIVYSVEDFR